VKIRARWKACDDETPVPVRDSRRTDSLKNKPRRDWTREPICVFYSWIAIQGLIAMRSTRSGEKIHEARGR